MTDKSSFFQKNHKLVLENECTLSELFHLEKLGRYQEALNRINAERNKNTEMLPGRRLNLQLLEQRLRVYLKRDGCPNNLKKNSFNSGQKETWSAIITMWKRKDYLKEQLAAIQGQSIPPQEIIILINERHIPESTVRDIAGPNSQIISSDINSLYTRWALAYIAKGDYIAVFDDDVIMGEYWIANAIRACKCYNALVVPQGRIFNRKGKYNFFKLVTPDTDVMDKNIIPCNETDVLCDWGCNSYFFRREWVGYILGQERYQNSCKTFDDIQLATSLFLNGGIRCVTPMQPAFDKRLHGSLRREYGSDAYAIWKTNSERHFSERKAYVEILVQNGYIPVQQRENLCLFHIIVPFGERSHIERCLLSIKGQVYQNFTCTLIDDCRDGNDALDLVLRLGLDSSRIRYIKTLQKAGPLRAREMATDMLAANPADVIVHLDGDDWFACPDVLARLNRIYCKGNILVSYGNALCLRNHDSHNFQEYSHYDMSKKWNVKQKDVNARVFPFRRIDHSEVSDGWSNAPWCGMHVRTFQFAKWLGLNRKTFRDRQGKYLCVGTDAAILIPILDSCRFESIAFVPDITYVYQNANNTIHAKKEISGQQKTEAFAAVAQADGISDGQAVCLALREGTSSLPAPDAVVLLDTFHPRRENHDLQRNREYRPLAKTLPGEQTGIATIITPHFLGDAILCLESYRRNLRMDCQAYIFITTDNADDMSVCAQVLEDKGLKPLFPNTLQYTISQSRALERKYTLYSDQYRWAMKSVILIELLQRRNSLSLFLDPDIYTVSEITDIHRRLMSYPISVFPHFRNPDDEYLRSVLYKDGFFNGGILAATSCGIPYLTTLYKRCLHEMEKEPERHRWDDQKYYDLFTLEVEGLYVNSDRGIDYNPWNYESVEGLIAPSQRSILLQSGYFIRVWHMSTMLIYNSIKLKEKKFSVYRPIISIYLLSILYTIVLILVKIKIKGLNLGDNPLNLISRYDEIEGKIMNISENIPVENVRNLLKEILKSNIVDVDTILHQWTNSILNSICFDNFEVFARMLEIFFPNHKKAEQMKDYIRRRDLRYIADEVIGSPELHQETMVNLLEAEGAGALIKKQLSALKSCNITY